MKTNATILTETAEAFVRLGLKDLGYTYVNSDDGWNGGREQNCAHGQPTCPGGKDQPHGAMPVSRHRPHRVRPQPVAVARDGEGAQAAQQRLPAPRRLAVAAARPAPLRCDVILPMKLEMI